MLIRLPHLIEGYKEYPDDAESLAAGVFETVPEGKHYPGLHGAALKERIKEETVHFVVFKDGDIGFSLTQWQADQCNAKLADDFEISFLTVEQVIDITTALRECGISNPNFGGA